MKALLEEEVEKISVEEDIENQVIWPVYDYLIFIYRCIYIPIIFL